MTEFNQFNGALRSPYDARDYTIETLVPDIAQAGALPNEFSLQRPKNIKNQGTIGSCVAHALSTAKEIEEYYQNSSREMSVGYIYGNRRGFDYTGEGMYPNEALYNLKKYGVCEKSLFPYNQEFSKVNSLRQQNESTLDKNAALYKISAYAKLNVDNSGKSIKQALVNIGPVLACWMLYDSFSKVPKTGIVPNPNTKTEECVGSHAMCIVGYKKINNKDYYIVVNSWGNFWGDDGLCYIPASYQPYEAWSITDNIYPAKNAKFKDITFKLAYPDRVFLDNIAFTLSNNIQLINDKIYVPLRFISEAFGCTVTWLPNTKQIKINSNGNNIMFTINSKTVTVNGKSKMIEDTPLIVNSLTYIPLRALSDILGYDVSWESTTKTARIQRKI